MKDSGKNGVGKCVKRHQSTTLFNDLEESSQVLVLQQQQVKRKSGVEIAKHAQVQGVKVAASMKGKNLHLQSQLTQHGVVEELAHTEKQGRSGMLFKCLRLETLEKRVTIRVVVHT